MRKSIFFVVAAAMSCLFGQAACADVVASVDFNSPTYTDGGLIGQDGWIVTSGGGTNPITVANTGSNGNVSLIASGEDVRRPFAAQPIAGLASIDVTADILVTAVQGTGDYFLHLGDNTNTVFNARIYARPSTNAGFFQMAFGTGSGLPGAAGWGGDLAIGTPITINARYDIVSGLANDTGELRVDGNSYIAATTIGTDAVTFSSVSLRQGAAANGPSVTIDNIVVNTTAIPEPGSAVVLMLAAFGMASIRRK